MKSYLNPRFLALYRRLPEDVRQKARAAYALWKADPSHPSLRFKKVGTDPDRFSVRVGRQYRVLGDWHNDTMVWFFIGSHAEYDEELD